MPSLDLDGWLARLESLHPREIELGLDRAASVASSLDLLDPVPRVVTVAGTNGKGSVVAVLEALALDAGLGCGVYTSPHLLDYNERVRVSGVAVDDRDLVDAFSVIDSARGDTSLTYFEFATLAALLIFKARPLDLLILEVGLGGRLDAVNIIDPDIAVITSISKDHQDWLGDDLESIGAEKAGILRPGIPAVIADPSPPGSVRRALQELDCQSSFDDPVLHAQLPPGPLRPENVSAALRVAGLLEISPSPARLRQVLEALHVPGRLERREVAGRQLVLDVAHNPAAAENMATWLEGQATGRCVALFAALSDKDIHAMIRASQQCFSAWYVSGLPGVARAMDPVALASSLEEAGATKVVPCSDPEDCWRQALVDTEPGDTLVVFGSFYTVAGFMQLLREERSTA